MARLTKPQRAILVDCASRPRGKATRSGRSWVAIERLEKAGLVDVSSRWVDGPPGITGRTEITVCITEAGRRALEEPTNGR